MKSKNIALLGSTGSIGTQALEVVDSFPEMLTVRVLSGGKNVELLKQQALKYRPSYVVVAESSSLGWLQDQLRGSDIKVLCGQEGLVEAVQSPEVDLVLNAIVGSAGLMPTCKAIQAGKDIALANKETLVVAGELVMGLAQQHGVRMIPVDSEHSAIFQCLVGEADNAVDKIYLTASGGPFRGKNKAYLETVTRAQALKHPNWEMGAKITIDSASMMNKGLEVIEARWLFGLTDTQIDVIVHPQSIIHSLVQFEDGSLKAQLGLPDMKLPIQYALGYPKRLANHFERFDFASYAKLDFEKPDLETFRNLQLAYTAMKNGGNQPCVMNAANEVVVDAFLQERLGFLAMSDVVEETMCQVAYSNPTTVDEFVACDRYSRNVARDLIDKIVAAG